ncbi:MAG: tRNA methyl transferase PRC-barrel domain-containing protein, partial [Cellulosilyticaceae bacterium]
GLAVASKPDSQEICFVPDNDYAGYIERETGKKMPKGKFVTKEGKVLGEHKGIIHYTIGQRKGLGLSCGKPVFVSKIDPKTNTVVVGDNEDLFTHEVVINKLNFMPFESLPGKMQVTAKIRYSHTPAKCLIEMVGEDTLKCTFEEPQRAITPGQAVVLYMDDLVIGGGTII